LPRWRSAPAVIIWLVLIPALHVPAHGRSALELELEVRTAPVGAPPARRSPSGVVVVLNSMSEALRARLADSLAGLAAAINKRKNPLFVRLDDSEERAAAVDLIQRTTPAFTAAAALCAGEWRSADGDLLLRPVRRCAAAARCIDLAKVPDHDELEQRGRFLAWPLGHAIALATAGSRQAKDTAEALRAPGSTQIALVLTGADLHRLRESPALKRLLVYARQVKEAAPAQHSALIDLLGKIADAANVPDELPWLTLSEASILVVPRLGALATTQSFVADVRSRLQASHAQVEWLTGQPP
jgi:hypothetical protein